jgi:hypothetical protein
LLFIVSDDFPGNENYREEAFDFFRAVIQNKLRYSSAIPGTAARMHVLYKNSLHLRRTLLEITYSPHALHGPRAIWTRLSMCGSSDPEFALCFPIPNILYSNLVTHPFIFWGKQPGDDSHPSHCCCIDELKCQEFQIVWAGSMMLRTPERLRHYVPFKL